MIDDLCIWKEVTGSSKNIIREHIRQASQNNIKYQLENCLSCLGTDKECKGYYSRMRYYEYLQKTNE